MSIPPNSVQWLHSTFVACSVWLSLWSCAVGWCARAPPADPRVALAELARQARDIARRHPWLAALLHRPMPPGPNGLRYLDYFLGLLAGSRLGTGAKLEVIAMISGFATMYGAMQAAPAGQLASAAEQVQALARAAAKGRYPNLTAALATTGQPRSRADIFGSCIESLIELARLRLHRPCACQLPTLGMPEIVPCAVCRAEPGDAVPVMAAWMAVQMAWETLG